MEKKDSPKIKIKNKYLLFKYNPEKTKIKKITEGNKMGEIKEQVIGKKISSNNEVILMKLSKEKKFNPNASNNLGKLIGGPIKITFKVYEITSNHSLKPKYEKIPNKKGELDSDKRNSQFLFITIDHYISKGIKTSDMELVALLAIQFKLERRLLAPKLIDQIYKTK
jgi:hypothetical protein